MANYNSEKYQLEIFNRQSLIYGEQKKKSKNFENFAETSIEIWRWLLGPKS